MDLPDISLTAVLAPLYAVIEVVGIASAVHAAMRVRTAQGSFAWCLALIAFPAISLPLWWVFGRRKIHGYLQTIRDAQDQNQGLINEVYSALEVMRVDHGWLAERDLVPLERLSDRRFTVGNCVKLLVNGEETFGAIFEAIDAAEHYILVEYYIVADDQIGGEFQRKLIEKVRAGVRVHFLYDEIGSYELPKRYVSELREAGCDASAFKTTIGKTNRFQINFRNHRKIVVVDGHTAFVGGLNVADDYLGRNPEYGHWRDTHLRLHGPVRPGGPALLFGGLVLGDPHLAAAAVEAGPARGWQHRRARAADRADRRPGSLRDF
ncbi:MAG: phospholipase D-like domain-containing protein [Verrucomicrobiales bacterium]